jgi:hypothetical protein
MAVQKERLPLSIYEIWEFLDVFGQKMADCTPSLM